MHPWIGRPHIGVCKTHSGVGTRRGKSYTRTVNVFDGSMFSYLAFLPLDISRAFGIKLNVVASIPFYPSNQNLRIRSQ